MGAGAAMHPRDIPSTVSDVLGGLSPARARDILPSKPALAWPRLRFFFP